MGIADQPSRFLKGGESNAYNVPGNRRSERHVGNNPALRLQVAGRSEVDTYSTVVIVNLQNESAH